jgi:predicted O-linked N-acetylglucosamine transferase (SPINDLY family)
VAGHTGGARLGVFVRRAAPVQVTFLGYPTATGIDVMDYRVTDARVDPPGADDAGPEAPLRLPHSYFCYRPPADAPPVGPLPAPGAGHVTFGSFNNLAKASAATLDLWAAVLRAVPASRLVLKNRSLVDSVTRMRIAERLDARGVDPARLAMSGWEAATHSHLAWYHRVDVALDSFPYNGATTTCEAMWMGVPVVSLTGATHAARMGCSILAAAGAADLAVESPAAFVDRCVALVADLPALAARRAALRATLAASPLLDEEPYVRELERLYRSALERRAA